MKKLIETVSCLALVASLPTCNHTRKSHSHNPAVQKNIVEEEALASLDRHLEPLMRKSGSPGIASWTNENLWGLVDVMLGQNQLYLLDSAGRPVSIADYRQQPSNYFILYESVSEPSSFIALHTNAELNAPSQPNPDQYTLSYQFFRHKGDIATFDADQLGAAIHTSRLAFDQSGSSMQSKASAIEQFMQAALGETKLAGLAGLQSFLLPQTFGASSQSNTFLVAAIVLGSVSTVAHWNCDYNLKRYKAVAAIATGFFYWLRKPSPFDPPTTLASNFTRPVDHNDSVTRRCTSYSSGVSAAQKNAYLPMMTNERHRFFHLIWHALRNSWHTLSDDLQAAVQRIDPDLVVRRPLHAPDFFQRFRSKYNPFENGAGEDFLYMHRQMVHVVQGLMVSNKLPCIGPWENVPASDDAFFPVPNLGQSALKSNLAERIMNVLEKDYFHNQKWLATQSLSSVGHTLEFSLHGLFHLRWADEANPLRNRPFINPATLMHFPEAFLAADADYLADPFQAHVNPVFWKLHGYVDDIIDRWLVAHNFSSIAKDCGLRTRCYQWKIAADAHRFEHPAMMKILEKFRTYAAASDQASEELADLFKAIEPYRVMIAKQPTTDPVLLEKSFKILEAMRVPAEDAVRLGTLFVAPLQSLKE